MGLKLQTHVASTVTFTGTKAFRQLLGEERLSAMEDSTGKSAPKEKCTTVVASWQPRALVCSSSNKEMQPGPSHRACISEMDICEGGVWCC